MRTRMLSLAFALSMVYGGADAVACIWDWLERGTQPILGGKRIRSASDG